MGDTVGGLPFNRRDFNNMKNTLHLGMDFPKETINNEKLPRHKLSDYKIKHVKRVYSVPPSPFSFFKLLYRSIKKHQLLRANSRQGTSKHSPMDGSLSSESVSTVENRIKKKGTADIEVRMGIREEESKIHKEKPVNQVEVEGLKGVGRGSQK